MQWGPSPCSCRVPAQNGARPQKCPWYSYMCLSSKKKLRSYVLRILKQPNFQVCQKKTQKLFNPVVPQTPAGKKTRGADDAILNRGCAECFQDDNLKFRPDAAIAGNVSPRNCCSSACHCTHAYNLFLGTPVQPSVKCGYTSASQMNSSTTSVFTFFSPFY